MLTYELNLTGIPSEWLRTERVGRGKWPGNTIFQSQVTAFMKSNWHSVSFFLLTQIWSLHCFECRTYTNANRPEGSEHTLETVPFSSTSRGALLLTGGGSGWSRHRQQNRLEKRPPLLGFLEERDGEEPRVDKELISVLCTEGISLTHLGHVWV